MKTPPSDPLQLWKRARHQLNHAIQQFLENSTTLNIVLSSRSVDSSFLEEATSEVHQDLSCMATRMDNLEKTQVILRQIRNSSASLVPINKLPPEILLHVFQILTFQNSCRQYHSSISSLGQHKVREMLLTLTHVCTRWRTIVVGAPSFWSHIHLDVKTFERLDDSCNLIEAYFQRANDQPLCIQFDGRSGVHISSRITRRIADCLHPHLKRVELLHLINVNDYSGLLQLLTLWLTNGKGGSVHTLVVWLNNQQRDWKLHSINALSEQRVNSCLLPVRVLRLNGVYFDWTSQVYHNLLMLQVGSLRDEATPTLQEITTILASSPQLQTLQLSNMTISNTSSAVIQPVVLNNLKVLDLLHLDPEAVCMLLALIVLPSKDLSVRVDLQPSNSDAGIAIQGFLSCSDVTRLYIYPAQRMQMRSPSIFMQSRIYIPSY